MADASWILPLAGAVIEHREDIGNVFARIKTRLLGKKFRIAMTGVGGAGKSVLFDHLTGAAFTPNYSPPLTSQAVEHGKRRAEGRKLALAVIPGQGLSPRFDAIDEVFEGENPVDGVIHVMPNGYASVRRDDARSILTRDKGIRTISQLLDYQRNEELIDLRETCEIIRRSLRRHRKPPWMLVTVAKADLYYQTLDDAKNRYWSDVDSPFVVCLNNLRSHAGTDNFRWTACPVAAWPESFGWGAENVPSDSDTNRQNYLLKQFCRELESLCNG